MGHGYSDSSHNCDNGHTKVFTQGFVKSGCRLMYIVAQRKDLLSKPKKQSVSIKESGMKRKLELGVNLKIVKGFARLLLSLPAGG